MAHIHPHSVEPYEYPTDPLVLEKLKKWQDQKFGLMMHWGLYAQLGIVESWALVAEGQPFQDRGGIPYDEFKRMYFGLIEEFNPTEFDPQSWAQAATDAGMKYLVFSTKHHDGFSMWDTQQTDFRITGPDSPFQDNPRADIVGEVFQAFREHGHMIGAYFSKPDWHHPDYWAPQHATPNRNNNYDTRLMPEKWQQFRDFTYNQIEELMTDYGPLDILWLDGGWVRPHTTINDEVRSWGFDIAPWDQDIDMPRISAMARKHQPGILVVDRTVHGEFENYRTPEQQVPEQALLWPWETCMTLTQSWGHSFEPEYKSSEYLVHTLVDVVSKGGNFLLNIGPTPQGTWEQEAYNTLAQIGQWLAVNGEAIYETRQWDRFGDGDHIRYTHNKKSGYIYAIATDWPVSALKLRLKAPRSVALLGYESQLTWTYRDGALEIHLPVEMQYPEARPCRYAWCFRLEY